jgi:hypothetical protein
VLADPAPALSIRLLPKFKFGRAATLVGRDVRGPDVPRIEYPERLFEREDGPNGGSVANGTGRGPEAAESA